MKVAICIPCHGDPKADFTFCLARLIQTTLTAGQDVELETHEQNLMFPQH